MKKLIIFDFDGVLVDSILNMKYAWKKTCNHFNLKIPFSSYKLYIGLPFFKILTKLKINNNLHKKIHKKYNYYSLKKTNLMKLKKINIQLLKQLKKDYLLALFTSKDKKRAENILGKNKKLFNFTIYPSNILNGKPSPDGLNKIIKISKVSKKNSIYLGDTYYDYLSAKKAKIDYIHASWGYQNIKKIKLKKIFKLSQIKNFI